MDSTDARYRSPGREHVSRVAEIALGERQHFRRGNAVDQDFDFVFAFAFVHETAVAHAVPPPPIPLGGPGVGQTPKQCVVAASCSSRSPPYRGRCTGCRSR